MSVGEVITDLDGAKKTIAEAPFATAGEAVNTTLRIIDLSETRASVEEVRERLKTRGPAVQQVRDAATSAKAQIEAVTDGSDQSGWIDGAKGSLDFMDERGEHVQMGIEHMDTKLVEILGHLAATETALNEFNEMSEIAQENVVDGRKAGYGAIEQITEYQSQIATGSGA